MDCVLNLQDFVIGLLCFFLPSEFLQSYSYKASTRLLVQSNPTKYSCTCVANFYFPTRSSQRGNGISFCVKLPVVSTAASQSITNVTA